MKKFTYKQINKFWNIIFWIASIAMVVIAYINVDGRIFYELNGLVFFSVFVFFIPAAYLIKRIFSFFTKKIIGIPPVNIDTGEYKTFFSSWISMFGGVLLKIIIITTTVLIALVLMTVPFLEKIFVQFVFVGVYPNEVLFNAGLAYVLFFMPTFIIVNILGSIIYATHIKLSKMQTETKAMKRIYEVGIITFTLISLIAAYYYFVS